MKACICAIAVLCCLLPRTHADDVFRADQNFASIGHLLERADQAFDNNMLEDALRLYGSSMRAYEQFAQSFPTFAPDLVRFRINYCRDQMARIRQKLAGQSSRPDTPANTDKSIHISPSVLQALKDGNLDAVREAYREKSAIGDPSAHLIRATLYVKEGRLDDARTTLEAFLETFPNHAAANYNMAQLILRTNQPDFDAAREHYRRARENGAPQDEDMEIVIGFE